MNTKNKMKFLARMFELHSSYFGMSVKVDQSVTVTN
jgi:hypothetical protein